MARKARDRSWVYVAEENRGKIKKIGKPFLEGGKDSHMTQQRGSSLKMGEGKQRRRLS